MKVEILRSVMVSGESVSAGSLVEVSLADANLLIGMGKAVAYVEPVVEAAPEVVKPVRKARPTSTTPLED